MKRKCTLILTFLIMAIFLSGCTGGIVTPATDEQKVKSVINEYFLAINDKNWSKAKSCCVYESDRYYATCYLEDAINAISSIATVTCYATISNVSTYGNYADAYINLYLVVNVGGYIEDFSGAAYYYLQKVGNSWKIYGP